MSIFFFSFLSFFSLFIPCRTQVVAAQQSSECLNLLVNQDMCPVASREAWEEEEE